MCKVEGLSFGLWGLCLEFKADRWGLEFMDWYIFRV